MKYCNCNLALHWLLAYAKEMSIWDNNFTANGYFQKPNQGPEKVSCLEICWLKVRRETQRKGALWNPITIENCWKKDEDVFFKYLLIINSAKSHLQDVTESCKHCNTECKIISFAPACWYLYQ